VRCACSWLCHVYSTLTSKEKGSTGTRTLAHTRTRTVRLQNAAQLQESNTRSEAPLTDEAAPLAPLQTPRPHSNPATAGMAGPAPPPPPLGRTTVATAVLPIAPTPRQQHRPINMSQLKDSHLQPVSSALANVCARTTAEIRDGSSTTRERTTMLLMRCSEGHFVEHRTEQNRKDLVIRFQLLQLILESTHTWGQVEFPLHPTPLPPKPQAPSLPRSIRQIGRCNGD
jgi:hypothetical protein